MPPPFQIPPSVIAAMAEFDSTSGFDPDIHQNPRYCLRFYDDRWLAIHVSPLLTAKQMKEYVYVFNLRRRLSEWRWSLELWWWSREGIKRYEKRYITKVISGAPAEEIPKGKGSTVVVRGSSKVVGTTANELRRRHSLSVKQKRAASRGFPTSSPVRPNENVGRVFTKNVWVRSKTGVTTENVTTPTRAYYSRVWTGVRTPGFGRLKKKQLPVNAHSVLWVKTYQDHMVDIQHQPVGVGSQNGLLTKYTEKYAGANTPVHLAKAYDKALKRLTTRAGSGVQQNIAESLGTLGQTVDMIQGNLTRITNSLRHLRNGNVANAARALWSNQNPRYRKRGGPKPGGNLASNWLELQYGWKPLLNDIHWAMKKLSEDDPGSFNIVRTVSSARVTAKVSTPVSLYNIASVQIGSKTVTTISTCRIVMYWRMRSQLVLLLSQAGFTNPVNLAWELLPFSFVADWFLPIGPYLEQLSAWDGLEFSSGSRTDFTRQFTDSATSHSLPSPLNPTVYLYGEGNFHDERVALSRTKLTSFPGAALPSFKSGFSPTHIANGMALLRALTR